VSGDGHREGIRSWREGKEKGEAGEVCPMLIVVELPV